MSHPEMQYLNLLRELIDAPTRSTRNDHETRSVFGRTMRFDLAEGFPLLTTKRVFWRGLVEELLWFLSGSTNAGDLEAKGVDIWREWGDPVTRDMGPIYGKQMRAWEGRASHSFGRDPFGSDPSWVTVSPLIDQIDNMLNGLRSDPYGRRHVMTLWNPVDLPRMALPPCHGVVIQCYVGSDERLSLFMHQRSGDAFLGVPFNIASYALLLRMFAAVLGRSAGEFVHSIGDLHLYGKHIDAAREQIARQPRAFPKLALSTRHENMDNWSWDDIHLDGYDPHPAIKAEVYA